ncbi:hypothetical protein E8L99_02205 [Phreatobacter aquaticus]|uniref:Uncharacterized protein n=1 Tax=Phreatobacter aquaticus TaxID=2570229 RepID=A0A4D7QFT2_9HYPH|nr:hypothetical protein [Phreatobacter aquaticus]QCK84679.1 hypothetical protein E8L99_02205 [Phreatobacter aquaticus]
MRLFATLAAVLWTTAVGAASLDGLPVQITNASEPVLCAEKDNITLNMANGAVRAFRIEAAHPAYIGALSIDRFAPDWTACPMKAEALAQPMPQRITLYETVEWQVIGYREQGFWRSSDTVVKVGERTERNLHLIQIWYRFQDRAEEVLVVYPQDGYWRARPLPPSNLRWTAYGSSFLIGPVVVEGRPIVKISQIAFDPETKTFTLTYPDGNSATVRLSTLNQELLGLDVTFARPITTGPFAALRSMYVTEFNADVARIAVREKDAAGWREEPVMGFKRAEATDLWAGRLVPSRHNTSAPDMVFNAFRPDPPAAAPAAIQR